jgi:RimJ/RimL family protein N-acetyltransferase
VGIFAGSVADARLAAGRAFADGADRLELRTDVTDVPAARAALGAGFAFEGVQRAGSDGRHDLAVFARLRTDPGEPIPPALPALADGELHDDAVRLRVVEVGDSAALLEQERDPLTVATGFTGVAPAAAEVRRLAARAGLDWLVGRGGLFAIVDGASGRFAGTVRLRFAGPPQIGGIGYVVHPAFRGRGYTARALRLIAPWAFDRAGFARLELGAKTTNVASQSAALAAGFEPDGVRATRMRCPDGTFLDEARFALVNPRYSVSRISP